MNSILADQKLLGTLKLLAIHFKNIHIPKQSDAMTFVLVVLHKHDMTHTARLRV